MAKTQVKEIRDGLFSILWTIPNASFSTLVPIEQEVTDIPDYLKPCSLFYRLYPGRINIGLYIKRNSARNVVCMASYGGVKQELFEFHVHCKPNRIGCARFSYLGTKFPFAMLNQTTMSFVFEILIDVKPGLISVKKGSKNVLENLGKLWENKTGSDMTFRCAGDKLIKGHTLILATGSPVFAAMFQNDFRENRERVVLVEDIEADVLENLLRYIYVGDSDLLGNGGKNESKVADLLVAADKYAVVSLKEECELYLSQTLMVENAAKYFVFAHLHNCTKLHESALNFMVKNAKAVCSRKDEVIEMMKAYPELCYQVIQLIIGFEVGF